MKSISLKKEQVEAFASILSSERHGRFHFRGKLGGGEAIFVTATVNSESEALVSGRVTGPQQRHADYGVFIGETGLIEVVINLESPLGNYTVDKAYTDIVHGLRQMMKRPHKPKTFPPCDRSGWKGFYIKSTGRNGVGRIGKATLQLALEENQISHQFLEHCIREGFTMEHH